MSKERMNDELRSLGIEPKAENELNDTKELGDLVDKTICRMQDPVYLWQG